MQDIPILYEDDDLAVVNKPAMLVVNRSETVKEETLQDWWLERLGKGATPAASTWQKLVPAGFAAEYGSPEEIFAERGGIVHRLDKETSGVMVLAKNPGALVALLQAFRQREVQKKYVCLVHGKFHIVKDVVSAPLGRSSANRTKFTADSEGREAETEYAVQQFYPGFDVAKVVAEVPAAKEVRNFRKRTERAYQGFSLVECWPKTGRTHQIRVHMAHIKHPIVCDQTYLGKKRATLDEVWCPRLFLHAAELTLVHPRSGKAQTFTAPLPTELQQAMSYLQES